MKQRRISGRFYAPLLVSISLSILLTVVHRLEIIRLSSQSLAGPLVSSVTLPWSRTHCKLLALVPVSPEDIQIGTIRTWFSTISSNYTSTVCCVAVIRSQSSHPQLERNTDSCDVLHVPMVRPDDYLSLSEKVQLALIHAASYYDFDWLLKTDSDSFVCFSRVFRLLGNFDSSGIVHVGHAESNNSLKYDPTHKWYDPGLTDIVHNPRQLLEVGKVTHHPYMQGAGYIISRGAYNALQSVYRLLRYSPIEDIMVGGWLVAFTTHRASMVLNLWSTRRHCYLPSSTFIAHKRKGKARLERCIETNAHCLRAPKTDDVDVRKVAFVIEGDISNNTRQFMDLYESIRAAFPQNEVVVGDTSISDSSMKRFLSSKSEDNVKVFWLFNTSRALVLNRLVDKTSSPFACILRMEQKISWETMIARMLRPVDRDEADITSGFLVFNHNRRDSEQGLFQNGFVIKQNKNNISFENVEESWNLGPETWESINGTSGFLLARTEFLKKTGWKDYGPFTEAEFSIRLWRSNARVRLVKSGIRHGYHYAAYPPSETKSDVKKYSAPFCKQIARVLRLKQVGRVSFSSATVECSKRWFRRKYNYRKRWLNSFVEW
ncbi:unnamed protein product [Agarophyton chilense]|eukprot:gb/GEZJ01006831.1/.p1 GENE.gb/GEZJ01006831.1/~~gb/GEZJ01006831.1/.p1  ORF type:complete len:602 (-),score=50.09 gb/GEZJ01006831.1/:586-2391(-)